MSNLTNNRINTTATTAQITAVKTALQTINTNLPFLIGLTVDERTTLNSIDGANKTFTEDAIAAGVNNPTLLPPYISVTNMQTDIALFNQLDEIIGMTKQLLEKLQDTQLLAGSEAYSSALSLYELFGSAANSGMPGADSIMAQLKKRFANQGGKSTEPKEQQPPSAN